MSESTARTCPHCGTASKLHPVSAAACEQYENGPTPEQVKALADGCRLLISLCQSDTLKLWRMDDRVDSVSKTLKELGYE